MEMRLEEDYLTGDILIYDYKNFSMRDYLRITPSYIQKTIKIYQVYFAIEKLD